MKLARIHLQIFKLIHLQINQPNLSQKQIYHSTPRYYFSIAHTQIEDRYKQSCLKKE
jgi:hypothetical protein